MSGISCFFKNHWWGIDKILVTLYLHLH